MRLEHISIQAEIKLTSTKDHTQHQCTETTTDRPFAASEARHYLWAFFVHQIQSNSLTYIHTHYVKEQKQSSIKGKMNQRFPSALPSTMNTTSPSLSNNLTWTIEAPPEQYIMYDDIRLSGWKAKMCYISCQASHGKLNKQEMSSSYRTVLKKRIQNYNFPSVSALYYSISAETCKLLITAIG